MGKSHNQALISRETPQVYSDNAIVNAAVPFAFKSKRGLWKVIEVEKIACPDDTTLNVH